MSNQASEPTGAEAALWEEVAAAAAQYDALDQERQDLDAQIRAITVLDQAEVPTWRDLMQRRNRKVRELAAAAEAIELASLRWAELQQSRP